MGATFPNGIASFKQHRDQYDDITAADINKIQDEVVALEETLGDALTTLQIIEDEVVVLQDEATANANQDSSTLVKYKNLKELISALWEGKNVYAAQASATNKKLPNTPKERPYPPGLVNLNKPSSADDPNSMWNGYGFTLKKSGFWVLQGQIQVNLQATGPSSNKNFGTYEGAVVLNATNWTRALDRQYPQVDGTWHDVMLNPTFVGWLPKGTRVSLRAAQSSSLDQNIASAHLSVYRVRGR